LEKTLKGRAAVHLGLSGGLDSSALLAILCSMEVDVVVWMLDDGAEADEEQRHAENLVTRFGVESRVVTVDPTSLPQRFEETVRLAQGPVINGRALSKLLLFREVARGGADHFVSGTGADEVLLGTPSEAGGDRLRRLRGETRRLLFPIESRLPAALGLLPIMPFLEAPSLATALLLTTRELIGPRGEGKSILRQAMKGLLPDEVRLQPKQPVWHPAGGGSPETRQRWTALLRQWLVDRPTPARSLVDPATLSSLLKEHGALETTPARLALIEPTLLRLASLAILSHAREEERAP
jgi:asparagine synthetase B (glutamine-hydrolysing)